MQHSFLLFFLALPGLEGRCLSVTEPEVSQPFATKTAYHYARGQNLLREKPLLLPAGCEAKQLWHLVRHGTTHPDPSTIHAFMTRLLMFRERILEEAWKGTSQLCAKDLDLLRRWRMDALNITWASTLTEEGDRELNDLSSVFLVLVEEILEHSYSKENFKFRYTGSEAVWQSVVAYASGIFGEANKLNLQRHRATDPMLEFYEVCSKYNHEVRDNASALAPERLFQEGALMARVLDSVKLRTGVDFTHTEMLLMYEACRYHKARWPDELSPFCTVFSLDDTKVLEYWQDLKSYYEDGYGHAINYQQACPLLQDLVATFRRRVEDGEGPYGVFYFTHLPALLRVIARLGLYHDKEPLGVDRVEPDRKWRTSTHGIFATNLAFLLSSCDDQWYVSLILNERPLTIPGCGGVRCSWQDFMAHFEGYLDCDFDTLCENEIPMFYGLNGGSNASLTGASIILLILTYITR